MNTNLSERNHQLLKKQQDMAKRLEALRGESNLPATVQSGPPEVMLLLDTSSSMEGPSLVQAKEGALSFFKEATEAGYRVGLMQFDCEAKQLVSPTLSAQRIREALRGLKAEGSTNLADGLAQAGSCFAPGRGGKIVVVISDGCPNDAQTAAAQARLLRKSRIDIMVIPVMGADTDFLFSIASIRGLEKAVKPADLKQAMTKVAGLLPLPGRKNLER